VEFRPEEASLPTAVAAATAAIGDRFTFITAARQ
jgi:hypothetical protein